MDFSKDELLLWASKAAMKAATSVSYFLPKREKKKSFCLITVFKSHYHTNALVWAICILDTVTPGSEPARWQPAEAQAQGSPKPGSSSQPSPGHCSLLPALPAHRRLPGQLLRHCLFCLERIASFFFWADLNQVLSANNQCIQDFFWRHFEPQLCSSRKGPATALPLRVVGNKRGALLRAESCAPA